MVVIGSGCAVGAADVADAGEGVGEGVAEGAAEGVAKGVVEGRTGVAAVGGCASTSGPIVPLASGLDVATRSADDGGPSSARAAGAARAPNPNSSIVATTRCARMTASLDCGHLDS
jgi:hypothetical protein